MEDKFLDFKIELEDNKFTDDKEYSNVYDVTDPLNQPQIDCQSTYPQRIESGNFFAVRIKLTTTCFIQDIETILTKIEKIEIVTDCTLIVRTENGNLFNVLNTAPVHHCYAVLLKQVFTLQNKFAEGKGLEKMFAVPTDERLISLAKQVTATTQN